MATAEWAPPEVTDDWTPPEATTDWMPDEVAGDQQSAGRTALNALVAGTADVAAMPFQALRNVQTTVGDIAQKYAGTPGRVFADAVTGTGANPLVSQFAADKGGQLRQSAQENFPVDAERNPIAATIGGAVPQVVGMIGAHMALGPAAPLVLGGAMEAQGGFETADQIGVTSPEARLATAAAFAGTGALLERMGGIGGKEVIGSALRRGAIGVGSEMLEEPATGGAQDAITALAATEDPNNPGFTKTGYDLAQLNPSNADYWQKRKLEAIGGAVGGTMFAGVQALAGTPQEAKPPPLPETITSLQEEITPEDIAGFDEAAAEPALQPVPPVSVESGMFEAPQMEGQEYDLTPPSNAIVNEVIPTVPQSGASTVDEVIAGSTPADGAILQAAPNEPNNQTPIQQEQEIRQDLPESRQLPVLPEQQAAQAPQAAVEALPIVGERNIPNYLKYYENQIYLDERRVAEIDAAIKDWSSRKYKKTQGTLEIDDKNRANFTGSREINLGQVNERKRALRIRNLEDERKQLESKLRADRRELKSLTEQQELNKGKQQPEPENESLEDLIKQAQAMQLGTQTTTQTKSGAEAGGVNKAKSEMGVASINEAGANAELRRESEALLSASNTRREGRETAGITKDAVSRNLGSGALAPIPTKATETLRSITAALPPAKWTPEVFSQAERYYQTRDAADIENLTPIQRKYINEALYQADPQAAEIQDAIDREAERKIRLQASSEKNMAKRDAVKAEQAETWAESYINDARSRVSMGLDPVLLSAYVIKGAGIVAKGAKNYAQFTMKMVAKYGNAVKRYLRQAWQAITTREMPKLGGGKVRVRTNEGGFVAGYGGQVLPNPTPATPPPLPPEAQGPEFEPGGRMKQSQSAYGPTPQRQDEGVGEYEARENAFFLQAANDYLATHTLEEATAVVESNIPPPGMDLDYMPAIGERLIHKLNNMIASGTDLEKVQANALVERAETAWTGKASQDVGRAQQQRSAAKQRMDAYAEVMAARGLLVKRAKEKIEPRFEGGTTSAVTKLQDVGDKSAEDAGANLTDALEDDETPKKGKVKAVRDATEKLTKAQRTAESILNRLADTHQDPYGWKAKGEPDPVRAFYNAHLQTPKAQAEFVSGMVSLGVPEGVASTIYTAATMEIAARDEIARVIAEELAERQRLKQEQAKIKAEDRRIEIAENRASQLIYKTEERFRQGSKDLNTAKGGDSINKVFREEVKEPMPEASFFARLLALGVRRDVAERLRTTAGRERTDQQAMQAFRDAEKAASAAQTQVRIAENKASRLIYRTEEKLRQGSKDLKATGGDSINKVFRDHVEKPMTWETFRDRLTALNVGEAVAQRLMRTAERERTDQQAMEAFKEEGKARKLVSDILAKRSPKLAEMLRALKDKIAPGMTWRDIFSELPAVQKDRQKEIYRRLLLDERLKGLDKEQRLALAIELDRAWQKERQKVFMKELEREGVLGQKDKADTEKIKQAAPRLLRLMNVGLMNSELFREAIAKEYGIKMISAEGAAILKKMGEEIQLAPEGVPRNQKIEKFMRRLQDLTGATKMEILESWWTASVLSGWRTINDIALSIANGIEDIVAGSIVTSIRQKNFNIARKSIGALLGNLPTAFREAQYYMRTGDRSIIPSFDAQIKASLEDGTKLIGNAGRYLREQGGIKGGFGTFMEFVERIMTALDHINSSSTYEGAKMMAIARNPELWKKYMNVTKGDLDIIRQRARDELTNGKPASNKAERVAEDAQVKILIDRMFPVDLINQAREIGRESALQGDPQGLVGKALESLNALTSKPRQVLESMEKETTADNNNRSRKLVMFALRRVAPLTKILTGTKFVRTVGQSINRNVSYIPGLGWVIRSGEASMEGAKQDILVAKQAIGFVVGLTLLAALRDQDDEEENLTIEGSWKGMDASKRGQRLAEGFQPNTISWRDSSGRRVSVNYMQWGIAGIMATLGAMEDQRKYFAGEKAELDILVSSLAAGLLAWTDKAQLQGIQAIFSESPYSSSDVGGNMLKRLNKYASSTVGGLVPRIAKDIDAVLSPELRDSSEWWMKWAAQVPMLRELSSGKRMNIFAEDIKLDRTPFSRVVQFSTTDPAYRTLGMLNERDIWLSDPSSGIRKVKMPGNTQREMTKLEKDRYQLDVGKAYKQFIIEQGERLLSMDREKAKELVERRTSMIRDMAARRATMK